MLAVNLSDTDAEQDEQDAKDVSNARGLIAKISMVTLGTRMPAKFAATRPTEIVPDRN